MAALGKDSSDTPIYESVSPISIDHLDQSNKFISPVHHHNQNSLPCLKANIHSKIVKHDLSPMKRSSMLMQQPNWLKSKPKQEFEDFKKIDIEIDFMPGSHSDLKAPEVIDIESFPTHFEVKDISEERL